MRIVSIPRLLPPILAKPKDAVSGWRCFRMKRSANASPAISKGWWAFRRPDCCREVDEKVTAAMAPGLAPEEHGRLFPETEPCRKPCSALEADDVLSDLRQGILAELRQQRPDLFD